VAPEPLGKPRRVESVIGASHTDVLSRVLRLPSLRASSRASASDRHCDYRPARRGWRHRGCGTRFRPRMAGIGIAFPAESWPSSAGPYRSRNIGLMRLFGGFSICPTLVDGFRDNSLSVCSPLRRRFASASICAVKVRSILVAIWQILYGRRCSGALAVLSARH